MSLNIKAHPLVRKLESIFDLSEAERTAVAELPLTIRKLAANQDIARERDRPSQCCLLLEGFACRYKTMPGGRQQIFSFHIPGDIPDLQSLHIDVMDHNLGTVVDTKVGFIQHEVLHRFLRAHPRINDALWRDTLVEAAIFREWIANVGARETRPRLAHLICEIYTRLRATGSIAEGDFKFPFPLTQSQIGFAIGVSAVHVNRTLQSLRGDGLLSIDRSGVVIKDWEGLKAVGEFDPAYLHLRTKNLPA